MIRPILCSNAQPTAAPARHPLALPAKHLAKRWPYKFLLHPPPPARIDIAPDKFGAWLLPYRRTSRLSMAPPEPELLDALMERGRRDGQRWAQHVGLATREAGHDAPPKRHVAPHLRYLLAD